MTDTEKLKRYVSDRDGEMYEPEVSDPQPVFYLCSEADALIASLRSALLAAEGRVEALEPKARPLSEYHEDYGAVLWWKLPINEPPWVGAPSWDDWPIDYEDDDGTPYYTHWTPIDAAANAIMAALESGEGK